MFFSSQVLKEKKYFLFYLFPPSPTSASDVFLSRASAVAEFIGKV